MYRLIDVNILCKTCRSPNPVHRHANPDGLAYGGYVYDDVVSFGVVGNAAANTPQWPAIYVHFRTHRKRLPLNRL